MRQIVCCSVIGLHKWAVSGAASTKAWPTVTTLLFASVAGYALGDKGKGVVDSVAKSAREMRTRLGRCIEMCFGSVAPCG
jgi:hypothetical protein